jgi:hypothetical protein
MSGNSQTSKKQFVPYSSLTNFEPSKGDTWTDSVQMDIAYIKSNGATGTSRQYVKYMKQVTDIPKIVDQASGLNSVDVDITYQKTDGKKATVKRRVQYIFASAMILAN